MFIHYKKGDMDCLVNESAIVGVQFNYAMSDGAGADQSKLLLETSSGEISLEGREATHVWQQFDKLTAK